MTYIMFISGWVW